LPRSRADKPTISALAGAALLAAIALRGVPWFAGLAPPPTPFTHGVAFLGPAYSLLRDAAPRIPAGASVVVLREPRDPGFESYFFRFALALLPGRRVLPAAMFDSFTLPETWAPAEYRIVVHGRPTSGEDELVLTTPSGTVWRRRKR
jgi:hypothetical protein